MRLSAGTLQLWLMHRTVCDESLGLRILRYHLQSDFTGTGSLSKEKYIVKLVKMQDVKIQHILFCRSFQDVSNCARKLWNVWYLTLRWRRCHGFQCVPFRWSTRLLERRFSGSWAKCWTKPTQFVVWSWTTQPRTTLWSTCFLGFLATSTTARSRTTPSSGTLSGNPFLSRSFHGGRLDGLMWTKKPCVSSVPDRFFRLQFLGFHTFGYSAGIPDVVEFLGFKICFSWIPGVPDALTDEVAFEWPGPHSEKPVWTDEKRMSYNHGGPVLLRRGELFGLGDAPRGVHIVWWSIRPWGRLLSQQYLGWFAFFDDS